MTVIFRAAVETDLNAVVGLLADDVLGQSREGGGLAPYLAAFRQMAEAAGNVLIVGECDGQVVACYQLTVIHGISLKATTRAQIEGVRVAPHLRGQGVGADLLRDAEGRARAMGAGLLQFTTNKARDRAHDFYRRSGYADTHLGFKKPL